MKKIILNCLIIVSLVLAFAVVANAENNITIYVNEQVLQCDVEPYAENGRTMVPMRKIFESLNAEVFWDGAVQSITAIKDKTEIILQINNSTMYNNGVAETLDTPPLIVSGSTFVPLRAVSQSLNATVEWLGETQSVYIDSPVTYNSHCSMHQQKSIVVYNYLNQSEYISESQLDEYLNDSWYLEPVTLMYAADGRTLYVPDSEVKAHQNVGWYLEPVTLMYAADGRTLYVPDSEVEAHRNVGWYKSKTEADAAGAKSYSPGSSSQTSTSKSNYNNHPNSGGSAVYRTPSGKRYHFDPDCGGKNSFETTLQNAKSAGLTPCKKCAY